VGDVNSGVKVFEYRSNGITPEDLSRLTLEICKWFTTPQSKPFLAWDMAGPGMPYGTCMARSGYGYFYYYRSESEKRPHKSNTPGVPSNRALKTELLSDYRTALFEGQFITHSKETYEQAQQFIHDGSGGVCHQKSRTTEDNSAKGEQHGDLVTGEAILWKAMRELPVPETPEFVMPPNCQAARFEKHDREKAEEMETIVWVS
jgi:hypothetical protein